LIRDVERTYQITWVLEYERESKLIGKNLGSKQAVAGHLPSLSFFAEELVADSTLRYWLGGGSRGSWRNRFVTDTTSGAGA
jgi:hypothetical protein